MDSLRRVARNIVHFLCSNFVTFGLGMVASVVMARALGPDRLGIFHQVQWFTGTVSVVVSLGFITSITKFTAQYRAEGRNRDIVSAIRFVFYTEVLIAVASTAGLFCFASRIADHYFSPNETKLFMLSFLTLTPGIQTAIFSAVLEGAQVFRYQTIHSLTVTPLALVTKVYLMMHGYGLVSLFWTNLAFSLINLVYYFFAARREGLLNGWFRATKGADGKTGPWRRELWDYNRSMVGIHFVDILVWSRSENYFLGRFCAAPQIAYYNLAQNLIAKFTGTLPNLLWKILLPLSAEHQGRMETDKMKRTYRHALRYSAFIVFPTVIGCYIASFELIIIFYGHAYSEAKICFQILCVGALLSSLAQPGSAVIYASNKQGFILRYGSILAVLNIVLNIVLIPKYGARGAAASYAATTSLGVIGGFIFTTRKLGLSIPWAAWIKTAAASLIMGAFLALLLRIQSPRFGLFQPMQLLLYDWTGHDFDLLLGPRAVRLAFACAVSGGVYFALVIVLFKPQEDDRRILEALDRFLPRPLVWLLARKLQQG